MKKLLSLVLAAITACTLFVMPVAAAETNQDVAQTTTVAAAAVASDYFKGSTGTMNSLNGNPSAVFNISSGSIPSTATITSIEGNITVSRGSSPFTLYLVSPKGKVFSVYISAGSGTVAVTFPQADGEPASGTWKVYIVGTGLVSTATGRFTFYYEY